MNLHNFPVDIRDRKIYRIIDPKYVHAMFDERQNVLVSPKLWEDPFENLILNSTATLSSGEKATFGFRNDFYGQCWTTQKASDAMWRIYSPEKTAVRIRTTIGKLYDSLAAHCGAKENFKAHIGRVRYLSSAKLKRFAATALSEQFDAAQFAKTLLVKRLAFKHEAEVRLLYFAEDGDVPDGKIFKYEIDPHAVVEQMMVDPRLPESAAREAMDALRDATGFKGSIKRSLLYAPPKNMEIHIAGA